MSTKDVSKDIKTTAKAAEATADAKPAAKNAATTSSNGGNSSRKTGATTAATTTTTVLASNQKVLDATLWEFTAGIPRRELKLMISEANECEKSLKEEIKLLEDALQKQSAAESSSLDPKAQALLDSPFTPMDRYWTLSALLGRLRGELSPPTLVSVQDNKPSPPLPVGATMTSARHLLEMRQKPAYRREHSTPSTLLPTWKRIFSHRLAIVFKKPVRDEDAPGYSARIKFPMDLSLVRKLIMSRHIKSLADLHIYIGLIAHNCVKYNGRETDYGIVAREFEQMADDVIQQAVLAASESNSGTTTTTKAAPPANAGAATSTMEEKKSNT